MFFVIETFYQEEQNIQLPLNIVLSYLQRDGKKEISNGIIYNARFR